MKPKLKEKKDPIEKMLAACVGFKQGNKTLKQVWYAVRGHRNNMLIQQLKDRKLGSLLFHLSLDFVTWYGDRDDLVETSVRQVANHLEQQCRH